MPWQPHRKVTESAINKQLKLRKLTSAKPAHISVQVATLRSALQRAFLSQLRPIKSLMCSILAAIEATAIAVELEFEFSTFHSGTALVCPCLCARVWMHVVFFRRIICLLPFLPSPSPASPVLSREVSSVATVRFCYGCRACFLATFLPTPSWRCSFCFTKPDGFVSCFRCFFEKLCGTFAQFLCATGG